MLGGQFTDQHLHAPEHLGGAYRMEGKMRLQIAVTQVRQQGQGFRSVGCQLLLLQLGGSGTQLLKLGRGQGCRIVFQSLSFFLLALGQPGRIRAEGNHHGGLVFQEIALN